MDSVVVVIEFCAVKLATLLFELISGAVAVVLSTIAVFSVA